MPALVACGSGSGTESPEAKVTPGQLRGALPGRVVQAPNVTLPTIAGGSFNFALAASSKILMVYYGYTHCPDECPTSMADMATALRMSPDWVRRQVTVAFVTTDPKRDTPTVLRTWLDKFSPSFVGVTGTPKQIAAAQSAMHLPIAFAEKAPKGSVVGKYSVSHFSAFVGYDRHGQAVVLYPSGMKPSDIAADLPLLVADKIRTA